MTNNNNKKILPISVVIATLGDNSAIDETINSINQGNFIPAEILICIPASEIKDTYSFESIDNVKITKTQFRGQVAQRAVGLSVAISQYVMQLDDDVILMEDTLKNLYEILKKMGVGNVLAPLFINRQNGELGAKYSLGLRGFLLNCYETLICGAPYGIKRMGCISPSGIGYGVAINQKSNRLTESEWIPGGAVLSHKEDLIVHNYYPFKGKAYSEDLMHSILWRKNGCRLWTALDVLVLIDVSVESFKLSDIIRRYKAHLYVSKMINGNYFRTKIWLLIYCIKNLKKIFYQNIL